MAVVVVIAHARAHAEALAADTGPGGDVFEGTVAAIAVEAIPPAWIDFGERGLGRSVGEEDVEESVAIVVQEGDSAGHRFDLVLLGSGSVAEDEVDAGALGDVLE